MIRSFTNPPSKQEIWKAVGKIKNGKAGGESGILPEMLKAISDEKERLQRLAEDVCFLSHNMVLGKVGVVWT